MSGGQPGTTEQHKYLTLDGIRGVAALMIVLRHTVPYFGDIRFTESYLAVDLFFVLSGFVIAEAYNKRLAGGMSVAEFMRIRLIRLYPLYLLGTLLGIVFLSGITFFGNHADSPEVFELVVNAAVAILMLPSPIALMLYPINTPAWSLLFELMANALYACYYHLLSIRRLVAVTGISLVALMVCAYSIGNLDAGFYWSNFAVGIPRVMFSFVAGILIHKFRRKQTLRMPSWMPIVFVIAILCSDPSSEFRPWFDIISVALLFPAIVYVASATEPRSLLCKKAYALLGATSYGIYVLHAPFASLIEVAIRKSGGVTVAQFAPVSGYILLVFMLLFAWWVDKYFDLPARRLASKFLTR